MAVPPIKKIKHYRGDDFRYSFRLDQYVDPDDPSQGTTPVDMTGWAAEVEEDPELAGITVSAPDATGVITVDIPAEDTTDEAVETIEFDVQLTDDGGFRRTYIKVLLILIEQVA